ncbi:MAG: dienelactone hydrolase family protein [Pseudomonadota bacterium]
MKQILKCLLGLYALFSSINVFAWYVTPTEFTVTNQAGVVVPIKVFKPAGNGPFPAVVMMHGCAGVYSFSDPTKGIANTYREWGDRLVAAGYVAVMVDSFTPRGLQNQCGNSIVSEVTERPLDAYATYNWLVGQSFVKQQDIGLIGWSHGGSSVLATADQTLVPSGEKPFKIIVAFYPGCWMSGAFNGVNKSTWMPYSPVVILHGTEDQTCSISNCITRVSRASSMATLTPYTGAHHSFDQATKITDVYTAADLSAKSAADVLALTTLNNRLKH